MLSKERPQQWAITLKSGAAANRLRHIKLSYILLAENYAFTAG